MPPKAKLNPIDPSLVPFQVGEKVAFVEDPEKPGYVKARAGLYGVIEEIGLDAKGELRFDLVVIDPFTGEQHGKSKTIYRAGMEDIQ